MKKFLLMAMMAAVSAVAADNGRPMIDSRELDDPGKPFCYFLHPLTSIGMPWMPRAMQLETEGNLYTMQAEFCLFYGDAKKPIVCRQKQWLDGWIPVTQDSWTADGFRYDWEAFGAELDGFDSMNTIQFVQFNVTNIGAKPAIGKVAAAIRHSAGPNRVGGNPYPLDPNWLYEIKNNQLIRDGKILCAYSAPTRWEAVNGVPYEKPFTGASNFVSKRTETGIALYEKPLAPGESVSYQFKMPLDPVELGDAKYRAAMDAADYGHYRQKVIDYWTNLLLKYSVIHTPGEPIVERLHRAAAVHTMIATRTRDDPKTPEKTLVRTQTDGLPYPMIFFSASFDYGKLYDWFGLNEFNEVNFPHAAARQDKEGIIIDTSVGGFGHGQTLTFLCDHILYKQDKELGRKTFALIKSSVEGIRNQTAKNPHGLMRPYPPYDNEMIKGQWTSHNLWTLTCLRSAILVARFLDEKELAADWETFYDQFYQTVLTAVRASAAPDGYVPTGLYDFLTGRVARRDMDEYGTDQDWENDLLLWPTELLPPGDPLIAGTIKRLHDTKYREGIMTYRNGMHLHQYITTNVSNQLVASGKSREALIDVYHILFHCGSTGESFENMIEPWTDRDWGGCPPDHAWGAAKTSNAIRNLFIIEQGGKGGLQPDKRDILLFNAVSSAWFKDGEPVGIEKAPTSFGLVTALMTPRAGGAEIAIETKLHTTPQSLVVRIPYFVTLNSFTTDAKEAKREGDTIRLSPDARKLSLNWTVNPDADKGLVQELLLRYRREPGHWKGKRSEMPPIPAGFLTDEEKAIPTQPLAYNTVLSTWKREYSRRFDEHVKAGKKIRTVQIFPLQTPENRIATGEAKDIDSLIIGKRVTASSFTPGHPPELASDGLVNGGYWECNDPVAWWQTDLDAVLTLNTIRVVPYYADGRHYQFVVKTSEDGTNWTTRVDMSANTKCFGRDGLTTSFGEAQIRFIRLEMTKNSVNQSRHLLEITAYNKVK